MTVPQTGSFTMGPLRSTSTASGYPPGPRPPYRRRMTFPSEARLGLERLRQPLERVAQRGERGLGQALRRGARLDVGLLHVVQPRHGLALGRLVVPHGSVLRLAQAAGRALQVPRPLVHLPDLGLAPGRVGLQLVL